MPPRARSIYLGTEPGLTFATLHAPEPGLHARSAVLLCPPFGWEEYCSYRSRRAWAEHLAAEGHTVLRLDLPATGDSGGSPRDPGRVEAWVGALGAAAAWLRDVSDAERTTAIGVGLGGLLACRAAAEGAAIDDLVLWGVPARGASLLRELRAFARLNALRIDPDDPAGASDGAEPTPAKQPALPDGALEVGGFLLTEETLAALKALDLTASPLPDGAARRILLLERGGLGVDDGLRQHLERSGAAVSVVPGPGYDTMMAHPQEARPPLREFEQVSAWLPRPPAGERPRAASRIDDREQAQLEVGGRAVGERPFAVEQPFGRLAGVLAEPVEGPATPLCAVLLNPGALRRIGPSRLWVEIARRWAARGVPTLRLDLEGIGDADGDETAYANTAELYVPKFVDQVLAALDELEQRGLPSRFVLGGLCSGAYWSFHAALRDPRVGAAFLLNPRVLYWDRSLVEAREARKIGAALHGSTWRRLLRRDVPLSRVGEILGAAIRAPARARAAAAARSAGREEFECALGRLEEQGKQLLFAFGGNEPLREELEREGRLEQLGRDPGVTLELLSGRDHEFRPIAAQREVHAVLDRALERQLERLGLASEAGSGELGAE